VRAVLQDRYGAPREVLRLGDAPVPVPRRGEVLVRVTASAVHTDVWHAVTGLPYLGRLLGGPLRPRPIPGLELTGTVDLVGPDVAGFAPGDRVLGLTHEINWWRNGGALAEYAAVPSRLLQPVPARLTAEQAAGLPVGGVLAIQVVCDEGRVRAGHRVLVNGAGGAVGMFVVQIAVALGAEVTAVDRRHKLAALRALGAAQAVDFEAEDVVARGGSYDLVVDVASTRPYRQWRPLLTPGGVYTALGHDHFGHGVGRIGGSVPRVLGLTARGLVDRHLPDPRGAGNNAERLARLRGMVEDGWVTPVVDRVVGLDEVPDALEHLATEQAVGRVVVRVA
jgi:NADPH:quinone reductase-like Zn-dependent oxidoreductase